MCLPQRGTNRAPGEEEGALQRNERRSVTVRRGSTKRRLARRRATRAGGCGPKPGARQQRDAGSEHRGPMRSPARAGGESPLAPACSPCGRQRGRGSAHIGRRGEGAQVPCPVPQPKGGLAHFPLQQLRASGPSAHRACAAARWRLTADQADAKVGGSEAVVKLCPLRDFAYLAAPADASASPPGGHRCAQRHPGNKAFFLLHLLAPACLLVGSSRSPALTLRSLSSHCAVEKRAAWYTSLACARALSAGPVRRCRAVRPAPANPRPAVADAARRWTSTARLGAPLSPRAVLASPSLTRPSRPPRGRRLAGRRSRCSSRSGGCSWRPVLCR